MEMEWGGCLRTLTLAVAINRMELFLLPPYLPLPPHQNSCHKEALGELSGGHLVVLKGGEGVLPWFEGTLGGLGGGEGSGPVWGGRGGVLCYEGG